MPDNTHIDWSQDAGASNIDQNNVPVVPETAVTAHETALTITESQISDLDHSGDGSLQLVEIASFDFGASPSTSEDVDVTGYDQVQLEWDGIGFALADGLWIRTSNDGFSSDLGNGASDYRSNLLDDGANSSGATNAMQVNAAATGTANRHGWVELGNLASSVHKTKYRSLSGTHAAGENIVRHGFRDASQIDTHIRIFSALGNTINAGKLRVLGVGAVPSVIAETTFVQLLDVTPASETEFDVDITGYDRVKIEWQDIDLSLAGTVDARVSTDGITFDSGASDYRRIRLNDTQNDSLDLPYFQIGAQDNATADSYGEAEIYGLQSPNQYTMCRSFAGRTNGNATHRLSYRSANQTETHIRIFSSVGGNFGTSGRIRVLGIGKKVFPFSGALVKQTAGQSVSAGVKLNFADEEYDIGGWHDNVTNNTRLTVPAGVSRVRVSGNCDFTSADNRAHLYIQKNGADFYGMPRVSEEADVAVNDRLNVVSSVVDVIEGDYFELHATKSGASSVANERTWFAIEAVEISVTGDDQNAIHDNIAGEIDAVTEKVTPVSADVLLIEDSADSDNKKKVQIGNLPGGDITTDPEFDAKGDLIGGTGDNTAARLAVGADGQHLVADSGEATGLNWEDPPSGGGSLQLVELADITFSTDSFVDVDVTGYDQVQLIWEDVDFSASSGIRVRVSTDGVTFDSGASDYRQLQFDDASNAASDSTYLNIGAADNATSDHYGMVLIANLSSSSHRTMGKALAGLDAAGSFGARFAYRKTAQVDTHIRILPTTGTINSGKLRVLGVGAAPVVPSGSLQLVELASFDFGASSSTSEDVDVTGYDQVEIYATNIGFSAAASLRARTSSDGFSSDLGNGASDYIQTQLNNNTNAGAASTFIGLGAVDGTANRHCTGKFANLSSATHKTSCESYAAGHGANGAMLRRGFRQTAQVDTHLRITTNTGATINAGTIRVMGVGRLTPGTFQGALVTKSADQTGITSFVPLTFNNEIYDSGGWHDNVTNNSRLIVPAGVSRVILKANVNGGNAAGTMHLKFTKNGAGFEGQSYEVDEANGSEIFGITSPVLEVVEGDYFELEMFASSSRSAVSGDLTWFSIEEVSTSIADTGGLRTEAGNYTIVNTDFIVKSTGSGSTITLPTAIGLTAKQFIVKNSSGGNITVDTTASQTIDGDLTVSLVAEESMTVVSDGANYLII